MMKNKRQFPRKKIRIEVELSFHDDAPRTVITHDMSQGGILLQVNNIEHYLMGDMVNVRFKNPLENFEETEKDAIIVRHSEDGIAIAFVEMGI